MAEWEAALSSSRRGNGKLAARRHLSLSLPLSLSPNVYIDIHGKKSHDESAKETEHVSNMGINRVAIELVSADEERIEDVT